MRQSELLAVETKIRLDNLCITSGSHTIDAKESPLLRVFFMPWGVCRTDILRRMLEPFSFEILAELTHLARRIHHYLSAEPVRGDIHVCRHDNRACVTVGSSRFEN